MIDKTAIIPTVIQRLKQLPLGQRLDIRTYKRNRSALITKTGEDSFHIKEDGFYEDEFETDLSGLGRALKTLLKKEFPRSNKIRLYTCDADGPREGLKKL